MTHNIKHFFRHFLCVSSLGALCIPLIAATYLHVEDAAIMGVSENYLSEMTRRVYLYEDTYENTDTLTLLDVSESFPLHGENSNDSEVVLNNVEQQELVTFVQENEPVLMANLERNRISITSMQSDLQCMEDMTAYKSYIYEDQGFDYDYFDVQYYFPSVVVVGNYAAVDVYEELNYQYTDCADSSYELGEYNLILCKIDGEWAVADVVSDDIAFLGYYSSGYNLEAEIAAYNNAILTSENGLIRNGFFAKESTEITEEKNILNNKNTVIDAGVGGVFRPSFFSDLPV